MSMQLTLGIRLRDDATFDNFHTEANQHLLAALQELLTHEGERYLYLWGNAGVGRSHLLQACCQQASHLGWPVTYIPLRQAKELSPRMVDDLELLDLVCLDDIDAIAGHAEWEEAIFDLYNRLHETNKKLIITGDVAPADLKIKLPDLRSRLAAGVVFHVHALSDDGKLAALQLHARTRGMTLPEDVGWFLLRRFAREMPALCDLLDRLDQASLVAQRKLTIPFVKDVLEI